MRRVKGVHHLHGIFFLLLLTSGLLLYFSETRTMFNQWQFPLVGFHIWTAFTYLAFVLLSLVYVFRYLWHKPYAKKVNVWLNVLFFLTWVISGLFMYFQASLPVEVRNIAVDIHSWATFLFLPWVIVHSVGHVLAKQIPWPAWFGGKAEVPPIIQENRLERRDFVKFSLIGVLFMLFGGWMKWLTPVLSAPGDGPQRRGYFRIYNVTNDYPRYEEGEWELKVDGLVNEPATLNMRDLGILPRSTIVDDFHCVTGWSVRHVEMTGVRIQDVFELYGIVPQGKYVTAYSGDHVYFDSFRVDQLMEDEAMFIFQFDGLDLSHAQGYPCRVYHPEMWGYKSVKWVNRLEFTDERDIGYWQTYGGYDLDGYL